MAIKWSDVYELLENLLISEAENDKHNCGIRVNGQFENKLLELRECLQGIENKVKNGIAIYQTRIKTS